MIWEDAMSNIYENFIEYSGESEYIPKDLHSYKESEIESLIIMPKGGKKINQLVKVSVATEIKGSRIIKTPVRRSLEGQELTGEKYIIKGQLIIRIDYLSQEKANKICCLHYKHDFFQGVTLEKEILGNKQLIPSIFIEAIDSEVLSEEKILIITRIISTVEK